MVQAELHLAQLTDEELSTMGCAIAAGLTGNLAFPNPVVSPAELVAPAERSRLGLQGTSSRSPRYDSSDPTIESFGLHIRDH
ncbi:MAG: hypothetical protein WCI05_06135 [Myxococcales bacterium]